jgi:hypothetical protein
MMINAQTTASKRHLTAARAILHSWGKINRDQAIRRGMLGNF